MRIGDLVRTSSKTFLYDSIHSSNNSDVIRFAGYVGVEDVCTVLEIVRDLLCVINEDYHFCKLLTPNGIGFVHESILRRIDEEG